MKTPFPYSSIFLVCIACTAENESAFPTTDNISLTPTETSSAIHIVSPYFDWESTYFIELNNYQKVILPWYNTAETQIPDEFLTDYQRKEGWELVYNLCNSSDVVTQGKYYLIFYNKLRGILRVFYYNIHNTTTASTTFWQLSFNRNTSLLNAIEHFAEACDRKNTTSVYTTNLTSVESKSISRGWNCFDVELCYDPTLSSSPLRMGIRSYDLTYKEITLQSAIDLNSEGTIVSTTTTPKNSHIVNGINSGIQLAGKEVGNLVSDKLKKFFRSEKLQEAAVNAINGGATSLIKAGINLLFGSFLSKQEQTTQTLSIKTTGRLKTTGSITYLSNTNINPVVNLVVPGTPLGNSDFFIPSYNQPLGLWTLETAPILSLSSVVIWDRDNDSCGRNRVCESSNGNPYNFSRLLRLEKINVLVNPTVKDCFSKYDVKTDVMYYPIYNGDSQWGRNLYHSKNSVVGHASYPEVKGTEVYNDGSIIIWENPNYFHHNETHYDYSARSCHRGEREVWYKDNTPVYDCNFVVKVTVTFYPKDPYDTTPIVSTRTFVPQYRLDKNLHSPLGW